jgi:HIRAN domain.
MKKEALKKIYFTVTGLKFRYGSDFLERGDVVRLVKEPDNEHDSEAIKVEIDGLGKIGYVANSVHTVLGDCYSAGRMYEKIEDDAEGKVRYITDRGVVCELNQ